jgi:phosphoribosyl 1,2-cyclic phosphodiesterase
MSMKVKIWGARGSLPAPLSPSAVEQRIRDVLQLFAAQGGQRQILESFMASLPREQFGGFGGNTSCIEVNTSRQRLIIDAGSGIRHLGYELLSGPLGSGKGEADILFTHFHWDHLIGLPFFVPLFIPGNRIRTHAVQAELKEVFPTIFRKPFFPVPFDKLGATISTHALEPRTPVMFGDLEVTPYQLDHPDPCWGYRIRHGGKTLSYCVDTEAMRVSQKELGPDLPLYQGVDLMIFDSQYTLSEVVEKVDWGHAAAPIGLDLAHREGVKKVIFVHHDPAASDSKIADGARQTARYERSQFKQNHDQGEGYAPVEWVFGYEGMEITL